MSPEAAIALLRLVVDVLGLLETKKALTREEVYRAKRMAELAEVLKFSQLVPRPAALSPVPEPHP